MGQVKSTSVTENGITLDPRTKILLCIMIPTILISGRDIGILLYLKGIISAIPFLLFLAGKKYNLAIKFGLIFATAYIGQLFIIPNTTGVISMIAVLFCGVFFRFLPGLMMGAYMVSTTTVSEFTAAMNRIHMPDMISIPIAVMFRFFPTVSNEFSSINAAMKMRGIALGGKNVGKMLEYRLVPLMTCSVKIGDELSAAALTRGLGGTAKRTNVCKIGLHVQDILMILFCAGCFASLILDSTGVL